MTDPLGQSQVIPYLQGLQKKGHQIWLMSCEKPERYERDANRVENLLKSSSITWVPCMYTASPPVLSTMKDVRQLKSNAFRLIESEGIEVLHCRSYISALVGQAAKKKFGTPWIFDMRGFWADERVDGGIWSLKNPLFKVIYNFFKKKEKQYLKDAIATVSLTENAKNEILSWDGFSSTKIHVIPCCADLELFSFKNLDQKRVNKYRENLNLSENDFIITYLGSVGTWYMLDEMFDFFNVLLQKKPNAKFLFISGDKPESIIIKAKAKGIDESYIRVISARRDEVPQLASISDVSIFFIKPLYSKKASSPTKMGELMSLGIPLICNSDVGDVGKILNDGGNGILIDEFSQEAYMNSLDNLEAILKKDKSNNEKCAAKYYSLQDGIEKYASIYDHIAQSL